MAESLVQSIKRQIRPSTQETEKDRTHVYCESSGSIVSRHHLVTTNENGQMGHFGSCDPSLIVN